MRKLMLFGLVVWVGCAMAQQAEPLLFREKVFDFGSVVESGGAVEHEFVFVNNAGRPLRILSVQPSCGCTTPDWSRDAVQPGKGGFIKARFDPRGRPGYFNKSLTITTDYDGTPIVLQVKGRVVAASRPEAPELRSASGQLRLKSPSFNLGRIYLNKEPTTVSFPVFNAGDQPIHFSEVQQPAYIKANAPAVLNAGETGEIKISYDAKARNQYGFVNDNVEWLTDDPVMPRKSFSVYATIEEYFPPLAPEALAKAPMLEPEVTLIDLGRTSQRNTATRAVRLKNEGKTDLNIRAIQSNCSCLTPQQSRFDIKAGGEHMLSVTFTPQQRTGTQQKALTIYSNDPRRPVQRITFTIYIED